MCLSWFDLFLRRLKSENIDIYHKKDYRYTIGLNFRFGTIQLVRTQNFRKTNTSYPLIRTRR